MAEYKLRKELFYQGHSGGRSLEILLISAVTPASIFCVQALELACRKPWSLLAKFWLNLFIVVLPMHTSFVSPDLSIFLIITLLSISVVSLVFSGSRFRGSKAALEDIENSLNPARNPFLTAYRGTMMLATCIAILAVDFDNFPRRLAKTETYGVSLMDAGVGSVLLTQAMVSHLARNPSIPAGKRVLSAIFSSSPLLLIGGARLLGTRAADYHEHASEYGVHWNFFFTLAIISIVASALPISMWKSFVLSAFMTVLFEFFSVQYGLREYILSHPRIDLLSANREGIFGCIGYLTLFYSGSAIGAFIFRTKRSGRQWILFGWSMVAATAVLWVAVALLDAAGMRQSRRLVNISYITWTVAYNMLILCLFLGAELALHALETPGGNTIALLRRRTAPAASCSDALSDSFNRNLLALFLAGNLLTGLVNLSLPTIDAPSPFAFAVVFTYAAGLLALALCLHGAGITLKFW